MAPVQFSKLKNIGFLEIAVVGNECGRNERFVMLNIPEKLEAQPPLT